MALGTIWLRQCRLPFLTSRALPALGLFRAGNHLKRKLLNLRDLGFLSRRTKPASRSTSITLEGSRTLRLGVSEERFTEATPTHGGVRNSWVPLPSPGLMRQMEEAGQRQGSPRRRSAAEESPSPSPDLASLCSRVSSAPACLLLLFFPWKVPLFPPKADDKHVSPSLFSWN